MDKALLEFWAKKTDGESPAHYPLLLHMLDVSAVAEALWDKVLRGAITQFVASELGITENSGRQLVAFWAGLHDLGKATPAFQAKSDEARRRLEKLGMDFNFNYDKVHHDVATSCILKHILESTFHLSKEFSWRLASTLGGHHGIFPSSGSLVPLSRLGNQLWHQRWQEFTSALAQCLGIVALPFSKRTPAHAVFALLAGFAAVADWIASNELWFPYSVTCSSIDEHFRYARQKSSTAIRDLLWDYEPPASSLSFSECFDFSQTRPLQEEIINIASRLQGKKGLVIIEAPMGEGKTEAALYLADSWLVSLGQKGCYFALPTQATSNQMFGRLKSFLERRYHRDRVGLMLLHGHASLRSEFTNLVQPLRITGIDADGIASYDNTSATVLASEWFTYRKRGLLAPFGVGTIDQALLSVLQTKHFFVRLFGLAGKTVIFDEVHAYDAYMISLLERLLEWLAALNSAVIILSATLPQARKNALLRAYFRGLSGDDQNVPLQTSPVRYPRISWVAGGDFGAKQIGTSPGSAKEIRIRWLNGGYSELASELREVLADGGCAAIVCNTVDDAQELYLTLKTYLPGIAEDGEPELDLFHARYPFKERERRERRVLLRFGKPQGQVDCAEHGLKPVARPKRALLVATQVIEQSLDLDFDLMVTQVAPVDLILQRAGRLQRHRRERPPRFKDTPAELWILTPQLDAQGIPDFGSGTESVYDPHILLRSWLLLKDRRILKIPDDIEQLVEAAYGDQQRPNLPQALQDRWRQSLLKLEAKRREYENNAKLNSILPPTYPDNTLEAFNKDLEEDNPAVHESLQALTRISEGPSVQVLCLYGDPDHPSISAEAKNTLDTHNIPSESVLRALLETSINISHKGVAATIIREGMLVYQEWRRSPLLRHHYMLLFDPDGICPLGRYKLRLDPELGLTVEKISDGGKYG